MNQREKADLDNRITGHWGEDSIGPETCDCEPGECIHCAVCGVREMKHTLESAMVDGKREYMVGVCDECKEQAQ